ncbi:MAG TPA: 1-deoxy-D-xylulose-5-phosphate reductoisomerase [Myxococcota bacterium]|nr:1-deoxy-D-xylulose-5-phosphate reductoisomerase [Myxococcota bacterium]
MKRIAVLGSTGSVGEQTLAVAEAFPERYRVVSLAARRNAEKLAEQVRRCRPARVALMEPAAARELRERLGDHPVEILTGPAGLAAAASCDADLCVAAIVGAAGLEPTLAALRAGMDVALANKEALVMAGALVLRELRARGRSLLPVDSEHSAIFQALAGAPRARVRRLILTASGGPFRSWPAERIARATVEEALRHPNWEMGPKITIDSATLMNKGLEVIEARWLFDMPPERIEVVVHPESIVHSAVEFVDSSVIAQLGLPDMRVPIAVALAHPERLELDLPRLDLTALGALHFETPDTKRFPCLAHAFAAASADELAPAVLNAANEVAVEAFLARRVAFPAIAAAVESVLDSHFAHGAGALRDLPDVLEADGWARERAREWLAACQGGPA